MVPEFWDAEEILVQQNEQISLFQTEYWYNYRANYITDKLKRLDFHINELRVN
jgi:hypothetical protein